MNDKVKISELKLAASITCHSVIRTLDHLSEILQTRESTGDIKLHRTKCIALIKNIILPSLKSELIENLKTKSMHLLLTNPRMC